MCIRDRLKVNTDGKEVLALSGINAKAHLINNVLTIEQLDVSQDANTLMFSGNVDLSAADSGVVALKNQVRWSIDNKSIDTNGSLNGTWKSLKLKQISQQPYGASLSLAIDDVLSNRITWQGSLTSQANNLLAEENKSI